MLALLVNMVRAGIGVKWREGFYDYSEKKKEKISKQSSLKNPEQREQKKWYLLLLCF
jgi:3-hydroxyacyl-CoA dehydrogenase